MIFYLTKYLLFLYKKKMYEAKAVDFSRKHIN